MSCYRKLWINILCLLLFGWPLFISTDAVEVPLKPSIGNCPLPQTLAFNQAQYSQGPPCTLLLAGCLACENVVSQHGDLNSVFFILYAEFLGYLLFDLVLGFLLLVPICSASLLETDHSFSSLFAVLVSCFVQSKSILVIRKNYRIEHRHLLYTLVQACLTDQCK